MQRDVEREFLPMLKMEGMALAPYNVLASGKIRTDAEEERRRQTGEKGSISLFLSPHWRTSDGFFLYDRTSDLQSTVGTY